MASFICLFVFPLRLWTSVKSKHLNSSSGRWYDLWRSFGVYLFIFPAFLCCDLHICWFGHLVQLYLGVPLVVCTFGGLIPMTAQRGKRSFWMWVLSPPPPWVTGLELGEAWFFPHFQASVAHFVSFWHISHQNSSFSFLSWLSSLSAHMEAASILCLTRKLSWGYLYQCSQEVLAFCFCSL